MSSITNVLDCNCLRCKAQTFFLNADPVEITNANAKANADADADDNGYANANANANSNANVNANLFANANANGNSKWQLTTQTGCCRIR